MKRRQLLQSLGAGMIAWNSPLAWAGDVSKPKLIWVLLRGGMDSLHSVLPLADDDLRRHRGELLDGVIDEALPIGRGFALHPALKRSHALYQDGELLPIVATASNAKTRSHFKAQDILECGLPELDFDSGWLSRAVGALGGESIAIAHSVPISLRGERLAKTWYPNNMPSADSDLYARLEDLYSEDDLLSSRLMDGLKTRETVGGESSNRRVSRKFPILAASCAKLMNHPEGPDCAMLEMGGWDTHNNELLRLNRQLGELDDGIAQLKTGLGAQWKNTVVIVASEFGRTVRANGTKGTDHGTAGAMLLAGGAIVGGQVLGQWPGLAKRDQFDGRDLRPTTDMREWFATVLHQHWQLNETQLVEVFPDVHLSTHPIVRA